VVASERASAFGYKNLGEAAKFITRMLRPYDSFYRFL
jgi:hypothetical protein